MYTPVIPDLQQGLIAFLNGSAKVSAPVMDIPHRSSARPYHLVTWEGDIQQQDVRVPRGRVTVETFGKSNGSARLHARQVREAIIPPENVTWGVHAVVTYEDEEERQDKTITLSGARLESGPREGPDERQRFITTYLVDYF